MTAGEILRAAREKIADPKTWTHGVFARADNGEPVPARSPRAVCWCAEGALRAVANTQPDEYQAWRLLAVAAYRIGNGLQPYQVNDAGNHADVLDLYDRAIADWFRIGDGEKGEG